MSVLTMKSVYAVSVLLTIRGESVGSVREPSYCCRYKSRISVRNILLERDSRFYGKLVQ
jgi:hypothetical protein